MKHTSLTSLAAAFAISFTAETSATEIGNEEPVSPQVEAYMVASPGLLRGAGKCARNPQCRKDVARRAERLAKQIRRLATELAISGAEQIHALLGDAIEAPDDKDVLAKLDKLEALLAREDIQCSELKRELKALRAAYQ